MFSCFDVLMRIMREITLKDLLEAGCHFGHKSSRWHPKMEPYLYGTKDNVHIFDLVKTKKALEEVTAFAKATAAEGRQIIFIGTKRLAQKIIKEAAEKAKMPYVAERWLGGTLTNWKTIKRNNIEKLRKLKEDKKTGQWDDLTKKEKILLERGIAKLERMVGGLVEVEKLPAAIFVVDARNEQLAIREAAKKGIKVIAMVDSNSSPDKIDFVIPANDDATGSIEYVAGVMVEAISEGKKSQEGKKAKTTKGNGKPKA